MKKVGRFFTWLGGMILIVIALSILMKELVALVVLYVGLRMLGGNEPASRPENLFRGFLTYCHGLMEEGRSQG